MKKRKIFEKLIEDAKNQKISIILGPRQVGKTTVLKALYEKISDNNKCLFLDLDILENFEKISSFEKLVNTLKLNGYTEEQETLFYLFLDEFQRYGDLSRIMKNVYDNRPNIKIYATESSSLKIKERVQESLAGRKNIYYLYPLDFEEFLWFKQDKKAFLAFENTSNLRGQDIGLGSLKEHLEEFLVYGGYPEVVLTKEYDKKVEVLRGIFDLYVKKELVGYLKFGKVLGVKNLIEYLAINNGQKIKYEEAADRCALKQYEVKEYIEILKETFLLAIIRPFFTNKNKELVKIPKLYFLDNGVRNFFINNFNKLELRNDGGFLFEGFIAQQLLKSGCNNIKFWQDKQKHEVDFILDFVSEQIPIEVKFKNKIKKEDLIGLNAFLEQYRPKKAYLINLGVQKDDERISNILPFKIAVNGLRRLKG